MLKELYERLVEIEPTV